MSSIHDLIDEMVKNAPPLPAGWEYDWDYEERFNYDKKVWEFVATAKPVQRYKI